MVNKYISNPIGGELDVDWEKLLQDESDYFEQASERAITQSPLEENISELIRLGVLSFRYKGNYWITDGSCNLGPSAPGGIPLTFTRLQDACRYCDSKYSRAMYPVEVKKI